MRAQLLTRNVNRKTVQKKDLMCFSASLRNRCLKYLNEVQVQASVINRQRKTPPHLHQNQGVNSAFGFRAILQISEHCKKLGDSR